MFTFLQTGQCRIVFLKLPKPSSMTKASSCTEDRSRRPARRSLSEHTPGQPWHPAGVSPLQRELPQSKQTPLSRIYCLRSNTVLSSYSALRARLTFYCAVQWDARSLPKRPGAEFCVVLTAQLVMRRLGTPGYRPLWPTGKGLPLSEQKQSHPRGKYQAMSLGYAVKA